MRIRLIGSLGLSLALATALGLPAGAGAATGRDAVAAANATHQAADRATARQGTDTWSTATAERALATATAILTGKPAPRALRARATATTSGHHAAGAAAGAAAGRDATSALRDLALARGALSAADQRKADVLLARPTDGTADPYGSGYSAGAVEASHCTAHFCIHWVKTTTDKPSLADANGDGTPDWVTTTATTFEHVYAKEVTGLGYHAPKDDLESADHGPDGKVDVYLADLGAQSVYGYCTSDDPRRASQNDVSGFCVVDNDFSRAEYHAAPLASLEVTAAHEFFHDVQFGYDWRADTWLMEGTATWMEGEVYPRIHDNYQYLDMGPLVHPSWPVDGTVYGSWIFWRFLSEYFGRPGHPDPGVIREIWNLTDSTDARPDYSLRAVVQAAKDHHTSFATLFARFGAVNGTPRSWYSDGKYYPAAPLALSPFALSVSKRTVKGTWTLDHLASSYLRFGPAGSLHGSWRLRVSVNMPGTYRGSAATLAVHSRTGHVVFERIALDPAGNGTRTVRFTRSKVDYVELSLTNASTRSVCGQDNKDRTFSCSGVPIDDNQRSSYTVRAIR